MVKLIILNSFGNVFAVEFVVTLNKWTINLKKSHAIRVKRF